MQPWVGKGGIGEGSGTTMFWSRAVSRNIPGFIMATKWAQPISYKLYPWTPNNPWKIMKVLSLEIWGISYNP